MDRTEIGNAIIAGIAEGGHALDQMAQIATYLEMAGWVIVPREPTEEMCAAGAKYYHDNYQPGHTKEQTSMVLIWQEMIDAAVARS